jgi:A/G-specific adenine glycosylase
MSDFTLLITDWYRLNKRNLPWRTESNPYFIWLSEIILQQTRVDQGMAYYLTFIKNYPTILDLANAKEQDVLNDWQGLGYYSRAQNLHFSAKYIRDELNGDFPTTYNEIIKLKGIGKYTASAISSFAFNEKRAVVDGNVYRFLSRVFNIDTPINSSSGIKEFQELADTLIAKDNPGEHNQAIMEVGALICTPKKPKCNNCPLNDKCLAFTKNTVNNRPVKTGKTKITERFFHYLIFKSKEKTIIEQRTGKGIWQNMYQFPMIETFKTDDKPDLTPFKNKVFESISIKHVLSHQRIYATFHHFESLPKEVDNKGLIIKQSHIQEYPLPRIIDRYLEEQDVF